MNVEFRIHYFTLPTSQNLFQAELPRLILCNYNQQEKCTLSTDNYPHKPTTMDSKRYYSEKSLNDNPQLQGYADLLGNRPYTPAPPHNTPHNLTKNHKAHHTHLHSTNSKQQKKAQKPNPK
jgi:hypothetical protein